MKRAALILSLTDFLLGRHKMQQLPSHLVIQFRPLVDGKGDMGQVPLSALSSILPVKWATSASIPGLCPTTITLSSWV